MTAKDWAAKRNIQLSPLQLVELGTVDRQEVLCTECQMGGADTMLCSGLRKVFSEQDSEFYGGLRIVSEACDKYLAKTSANELEGRLQASSLPPKAVEKILRGELPKVEKDAFDNFLVDGVVTPELGYGLTSTALANHLMTLGVAICQAGFQSKFVYPQFWYQNVREWQDRLGFDLIMQADWLYVERLDAKSGTDFARDQMFSAIQNRVVAGLPTVVTLGSSPEGRNAEEDQFLKEVQTWQRINPSFSV